MYFQEICGIQMHLQAYSESNDYVLSFMMENMMSKYNKYWGDLDRGNVLMFVAVILDPQTKLESLEYWFKDVLTVEQCTNMMIKLRTTLRNYMITSTFERVHLKLNMVVHFLKIPQ